MWLKLVETFKEMNLPKFRQGNCPADLPESFFTYWNLDTPEDGFYDDESHRNIYFWVVYLYTTDEDFLYTKFEEFIEKAKEKGFKTDGRGKDIPSDVPNYLGRYIKLTYMEEKS